MEQERGRNGKESTTTMFTMTWGRRRNVDRFSGGRRSIRTRAAAALAG